MSNKTQGKDASASNFQTKQKRQTKVRLKNFAPKVKTGCSVCRIRRIKCDETRPACKRCTIADRRCFYPIDSLHSMSASTMNKAVETTAAPHGVKASIRERQAFDMLHKLTVNHITGSFDRTFWTRDVLQATSTSPIIWHAGLALAAMHHRMKLKSSTREFDRYMAVEYHIFALKQYNQAIQLVVPLMQYKLLTYASKEIIILASIIFTAISCLEHNLNQALAHITSALKLFHEWDFWNETQRADKFRYNSIIQPNVLIQYLSHLQYQVNDISCSTSPVVKHHIIMPQDIISSKPFDSATEAYQEMSHISYGQSGLVSLNATDGSPIGPYRDEKMRYLGYWDTWMKKFNFFARSRKALHDKEGIQVLSLLLRCEQVMNSLYLKRHLSVVGRLTAESHRILDDCEQLLNETACTESVYAPQSPVFSFSLSIAEAVRSLALMLGGEIRERCLKILRKWPHCDGFMDSQLAIFQIEARQMFAAAIFDNLDPNNLDTETCCCVLWKMLCEDHRKIAMHIDVSKQGVIIVTQKHATHIKRGLPGHSITFEWD